MNFKDLPIRRKIIIVIMLTSVSALLIAGAIFFAFQIRSYQNELRAEMESIAALIGANSQAAIEFEDAAAAGQILNALKQDKRILEAKIYDVNSSIFAEVKNTAPGERGPVGGQITIRRPILLNGKFVGSISLEVDSMRSIYRRLGEFGRVALLTIILSGLAAYLISRRLQRVISTPIIELSETAREVSLANDYTIRAKKQSSDEIGVLIDRFNEMLDQIKEEDARRRAAENELKMLNEGLELRVEERTEELRQSLEKLRRSERLASIGTLAAGMAHEIRNPINSILLAAQHALRYQKEPDPLQKKTLESIASEAKRCGTIVKNILLFAKSESTVKVPVDINEVVNKAVLLAKSYAPNKHADIRTELASNLPQVPVNSTEIEQVILNIINNAAEASPQKVGITIATAEKEGRVELAISDDGPGIPDEMVTQIFDPFFSTKRKQGNTGLGLSLCHGIIHEHRGFLNVRTKLGEGTTFIIELPRAA